MASLGMSRLMTRSRKYMQYQGIFTIMIERQPAQRDIRLQCRSTTLTPEAPQRDASNKSTPIFVFPHIRGRIAYFARNTGRCALYRICRK